MEAFGSRDSVAAGLTERTPLLSLDGSGSGEAGMRTTPYAGFIDRFRDAFRAETAAFVDLVDGAPNPCPPPSALDSLRAAVAAELSVMHGSPVSVSDVRVAEH